MPAFSSQQYPSNSRHISGLSRSLRLARLSCADGEIQNALTCCNRDLSRGQLRLLCTFVLPCHASRRADHVQPSGDRIKPPHTAIRRRVSGYSHVVEFDGYLDLPRIPCRRNAAERFPPQRPGAISLADGTCVRLPKMMHSSPVHLLTLWWKMFTNRG